MPVNIRDNAEYRRIVKSLVRKNIESSDKDNGHIKGLFSFLAGWRVPVPMKDHDSLKGYAKMAQPFGGDMRAYREILDNMPQSPFVN
jgi:hypothetical protein